MYKILLKKIEGKRGERNFFWGCLVRIKDIVWKIAIEPRLLYKEKIIKIETSSICNARCVWCGMQNFNKIKTGLMNLSQFKTIIDLNEKFIKKKKYCIEPFFNGEALLNPELFDMLDYLLEKKLPFSPRFDTNLSVNIDIKKFMSYPWNKIYVNIGGIDKRTHEKVMKNTDFDLVMENLKKMLKINKSIVYIKMNPTKHNINQFKKLKYFFENLGGKPENIVPSYISLIMPSMFSLKEKKYFLDNIASENVKPYMKFNYNLEKKDFDIRAKKPGCNFMCISIAFDGRITICCLDQIGRFNLGDAFKTPLKRIISSREYKDIKRKCLNQEFDICKECN